MRLRILGASGGIGGTRRTICFLLGQHVLLDAGSGAGSLTLEEIIAIDHVLLTHSHLDHIALLPLLADAALNFRSTPLTVHALPETWAALQQCVFNGILWPDYTRLPDVLTPYIRFSPLQPGTPIKLDDMTVLPLPVCHAVPAVGYAITGPRATLTYSADTTLHPAFWQALNALPKLDHLLLECTFRDDGQEAARHSGHMTPVLLAAMLKQLRHTPQIGVLHMEPGMEAVTLAQLETHGLRLRQVVEGETFEL